VPGGGSPPPLPASSLKVIGADCCHQPHADGLATPRLLAAPETDAPAHTTSNNRARTSYDARGRATNNTSHHSALLRPVDAALNQRTRRSLLNQRTPRSLLNHRTPRSLLDLRRGLIDIVRG
jgi:hypothetical protein